MSLNRFAKKRDKNEPEIIETFKKSGFSVESLDTPCDLIVGYGKSSYLVEVKTTTGKLTKRQKDFVKDWKGDYFVVRTIDEANTLVKWIKNNRIGEVISNQQTIHSAMRDTF